MSETTTPIACPACMHRETIVARAHEREACHDDLALMRWVPPPRGARGQMISRWDHGSWECQLCGLALTPHDAMVLLDAALMHAAPQCDSIVDGMHEDARRAGRGGRQ